MRDLADRCRRVSLRYSSEEFRREDAGRYRSASYYACARFVRAGEIAAHYDRDLLILDMDIASLGNVSRLVELMQHAELGYFDCGDVLPWLQCRAAAVYIRRSAAGSAFTELLCKYIASKIEAQGFWGLDQAALYVVSRFVAARRTDFRYCELSRALGTSLNDFACSPVTAREKQSLRGNALGVDTQISSAVA
jgi:hypothetical protein